MEETSSLVLSLSCIGRCNSNINTLRRVLRFSPWNFHVQSSGCEELERWCVPVFYDEWSLRAAAHLTRSQLGCFCRKTCKGKNRIFLSIFTFPGCYRVSSFILLAVLSIFYITTLFLRLHRRKSFSVQFIHDISNLFRLYLELSLD